MSADVFYAIAHPARRTILSLLKDGDKPAGELAERFDLSFSAISQHLKILRDASLVSERRDGRQRIYQLEPRNLSEVRSWVEDIEAHWNTRLDALEAHLARKHPKK
ncbi:MAG: metalloregulator ArsR/SmtB family transcription factor [Myxococcota bacterium]